MDIFAGVLGIAVTIIGWFIAKNVASIEGDIGTIREKVYKLEVNTESRLAAIQTKLGDIKDDLIGLSNSAGNLKRDIQDLTLKQARDSLDDKKVVETFGKVIVLEEKAKSFEKMHGITQSVLHDLKLKVSRRDI